MYVRVYMYIMHMAARTEHTSASPLIMCSMQAEASQEHSKPRSKSSGLIGAPGGKFGLKAAKAAMPAASSPKAWCRDKEI